MFTSIKAIFTLFKTASTIYKVAAFVIAIAGLYFGVSNAWEATKERIAAPYVAAERIRVEEEARLRWEPDYISLKNQFISQEKQYGDLTENIINTRKAQAIEAEKAVNKEKERANRNEANYKETLKKYEVVVADRDRHDVSIVDLNNRLRDITVKLATRDGDSAEIRRLSRYADDLGERYESCERALEEANTDADAANDRATKAAAGVRALSGN